MEPLRISMFPFFFLLRFSSVALASYSVPAKYFINCGSDETATKDGHVFVGESTVFDSVCLPKHSAAVEEQNKSSTTPLLYRTAKTIHGPSGYKFTIDKGEEGCYLVRLHFYAFSSPEPLYAARFNVSSAGFLLLDNFSVGKNQRNTVIIKEFYLNIRSSRSLQIDFLPMKPSNFAFVNAIELFQIPDHFIPNTASHVTSKGKASDYKNILISSVLRTRYMLDAGNGSSEVNDILRRTWEKDGKYAKNGEPSSSSVAIKYGGGDNNVPEEDAVASTVVIAPDTVYQTARVMTQDSGNRQKSFNVSWSLQVEKNSSYFIRAHFCDIISMSVGLTFFNFYIYDNFNWTVHTDSWWSSSVPFYRDSVVDSDDSGILRISVGPDEASTVKNAFLNGLEVMEIIETQVQNTGSEYECKKNHRHLLPLELGIGGLLALICIMIIGFCLIRKYGKPKILRTTLDWAPLSVKGGGGSSHGKYGSSHGGSSLGNLKLGLKMSFNKIQSATNNFHVKRIIGKGGFGNVYKGILKNGVKVAVKRSEPGSSSSGQGFPEFQTEIMVLSRIRHRHLVSLIGYCDERSEMILVYEYMEKGTLRDHLYNSNLPTLPWKQRLEICIGAARGLNYLHKGAAGRIIHRDVKSTNILLDENHVAKVADFGLSKTGPLDQQQQYFTTGVKGTFGYLDPEYFRTQQLTEKSDVYSFGVVLLEVLCARPALDPALPWNQVNLAEWGMFCKQRGTLEQLIDPTIKQQIDKNALRKFTETVEKCLREDGCERPTMGDVLWDLEYSLQLQRGARQRNSSQEDSKTTSSSVVTASIELSNVRRLPSLSTQADSEVMSILNDDSAAHSVFSLSNIDAKNLI